MFSSENLYKIFFYAYGVKDDRKLLQVRWQGDREDVEYSNNP